MEAKGIRILCEDIIVGITEDADGRRIAETKAGETIAVVGHTGAGKTTLTNLLLRFYDVQRGRILVDGVDVRQLDQHELRSLFSLVLQDVHLFSGTIASTIRLGETSIDDEAVAVALGDLQTRLDEMQAAMPADNAATLSSLSERLATLVSFLAAQSRPQPHPASLSQPTGRFIEHAAHDADQHERSRAARGDRRQPHDPGRQGAAVPHGVRLRTVG